MSKQTLLKSPSVSFNRFGSKSSPSRVTELRRDVYQFSKLSQYSFRQRLTIRTVGFLFYVWIAVIGQTVRWEVVGWHRYEAIRRRGKSIIFTFWHNRVFLATWFWRRRGIVVMNSRSYDGEYTSRIIQRFGYGVARGSSSRGASRALKLMRDCMRHNIDTAFTIDGPRGPKYVAKPGAVSLAKLSGQVILPFHISAERYWEVKSWDRFQIPYPFTRAVILLGEPIDVAENSSEEEIGQLQQQLQVTLDDLRKRGDQWWMVRPSTIRPQPSR